MKREIFYSLPLCVALSVTGCGGDGGGKDGSSATYSGSQVQAAITTDNSEQLARSATEAATEATTATPAIVTGGGAEVTIPLAIQTANSYKFAEKIVVDRLPQIFEYLSNGSLPSAYQEEVPCDFSGSVLATVDDNIDASGEYIPDSGTISMDFRGCRDDETSTVNGTATTTFTGDGSFTTVYQHFTVAYTDPITGEQVVETIDNMTIACDGNYGCSIQSDFVGSDGRTYRIENMRVSGSDTTGWNVSATVYDPDLGSVNFETTDPLMLDCPTDVPSSGALNMRGSNDVVATVIYTSCAEFQVCLESVCNTFTW